MHDREAKLLAAIAALKAKYSHQLDKGFLGLQVWDGWLPIVTKLFEQVEMQLTPFERRRIRWRQIKQKWGELRAYYSIDGESPLHVDIAFPGERIHIVDRRDDPLSTKVERFVREATEEAARTCERCGAPGERVNLGGHVVVACPTHAADWEAPC